MNPYESSLKKVPSTFFVDGIFQVLVILNQRPKAI